MITGLLYNRLLANVIGWNLMTRAKIRVLWNNQQKYEVESDETLSRPNCRNYGKNKLFWEIHVCHKLEDLLAPGKATDIICKYFFLVLFLDQVVSIIFCSKYIISVHMFLNSFYQKAKQQKEHRASTTVGLGLLIIIFNTKNLRAIITLLRNSRTSNVKLSNRSRNLSMINWSSAFILLHIQQLLKYSNVLITFSTVANLTLIGSLVILIKINIGWDIYITLHICSKGRWWPYWISAVFGQTRHASFKI